MPKTRALWSKGSRSPSWAGVGAAERQAGEQRGLPPQGREDKERMEPDPCQRYPFRQEASQLIIKENIFLVVVDQALLEGPREVVGSPHLHLSQL